MTHPLAINGNQSGASDMQAGDRVIYEIDGRHGVADEFLHDGDAFVTFDDGTFGTVKWSWLKPETIMSDPKLVEIVDIMARGAYGANASELDVSWEEVGADEQELWRSEQRAALTALQESGGAVVPADPRACAGCGKPIETPVGTATLVSFVGEQAYHPHCLPEPHTMAAPE